MDADFASAKRDPGLCPNTVVAAILTCDGRIGLFRRSAAVNGDSGRWHCITGFLPTHEDPLRQAFLEVEEETGIEQRQLELRSGAVLDLSDASGGQWRVHAFHFRSYTDRVKLNWENDASYWARCSQISQLPTVAWIQNVLEALQGTLAEAMQEIR